jgi:hypothetical protein
MTGFTSLLTEFTADNVRRHGIVNRGKENRLVISSDRTNRTDRREATYGP